MFPAESNKCRLVFTYSRFADEYAKSVPAGWHVLLDQLETVLEGRTEPYPFEAEEETEAGRTMKEIYKGIEIRE